MQYDKDYFESIERYYPFSFFSPLTQRSKLAYRLVMFLIKLKEQKFAEKRAAWIVKNLKPKSSLDVGTSGGELVESLTKIGIHAYGIDASNFQVKSLRRDLKDKVLVAKADELPFSDKKFDVVTAYHVLEHIPKDSLKKSLREMARVSNKYLVLEFPAQESFNARIDPTHISVFDSETWVNIIRKNLDKEWSILKFRKANLIRPLFIVLKKN